MKKLVKLAAIVVALSVPLYAADLDLKLGAATQKRAGDALGLNAALAYNLDIDRYFTLAPEIGLNWHNVTKTDGTSAITGGNIGQNIASKADSYYVPMLLNAKVMIPTGGDWGGDSMFTPYFGVGGGYGWMHISQTTGTDSSSASLGGLIWNSYVGTYFKIADDSAVKFLVEVGYRGGFLEKDNVRVDSTGWYANAGVQLSLGGGGGDTW